MGHDDFSVRGRRVVVVGAARSGIAAAELLHRRGARVVLTERREDFDRASALRDAGIDVELGGHSQSTFDAADLVVTSPGVPPDEPSLVAARRRGVEVIGEIELASRWLRGRVIAVTGTKGKSTTTTLLGRMVEADGRHVLVGGNIGVPLSSQVDDSTPETIHAVEVSSFQLETTTTFRPWIALWLNLADDHLDRHPDVEAYAAAKARIFANQRARRLGGRESRRPDRDGTQRRDRQHTRGVLTVRIDERMVSRSTVTGSSVAAGPRASASFLCRRWS